MHFAEIITNQDHLQTLKKSVDIGTIPHALLFWGDSGTGPLPAALSLSQYILCRERTDQGSCGSCSGCVKSEKYIHPDLHFMFPTIRTAKHKNSPPLSSDFYPQWREAIGQNPHLDLFTWLGMMSSENKQGNINVRDIHRTYELMQLKSFAGGYKILIIWMAGHLGKEGNKLLKLIEEPPDQTVIFLLAESKDKILPTIQSRCQQFFFGPLSTSEIRHALESRKGITSERSAQLASASLGDWNLAQQLEAGSQFSPVTHVQQWVKAAWSKDLPKMYDWANQAAKQNREAQKQLYRYLISLWQKVFWLKWGIEFESDQEELKLIKFLNTKIELMELDLLVKRCEENLYALERNVNARMVWTDVSFLLRDVLHAYRSAA